MFVMPSMCTPAGSRPSFALSYALRPAGPTLLVSFSSGGQRVGRTSSLYTDTQQIRCICHAIATVMVCLFQNSHDFSRLGLGGHAVPSLPEVQECHHVGRPGLIKYYFYFNQVGSLLVMVAMEEFAHLSPQEHIPAGSCVGGP